LDSTSDELKDMFRVEELFRRAKEAIAAGTRVGVDLNIKDWSQHFPGYSDGVLAEVNRLIIKYDMAEKVYAGTFNPKYMEKLKALNPAVTTGTSLHKGMDVNVVLNGFITKAKMIGASGIAFYPEQLSLDVIDEVHAAGLMVVVNIGPGLNPDYFNKVDLIYAGDAELAAYARSQASPAIAEITEKPAGQLDADEANKLFDSDDFGYGLASGVDSGAIVFKMDMPRNIADEIMKDLAANGISSRINFTSDGKKVPMDLVLSLWRDGLENSLRDLDGIKVDTKDGWKALNAKDDRGFIEWLNAIKDDISAGKGRYLRDVSKAVEAKKAVSVLQHSINSLNRRAEVAILRSRVSRQALLDRYGGDEGGALLKKKIVGGEVRLYAKNGNALIDEERDTLIFRLSKGEISVRDVIDNVRFQDFLKHVIIGATNVTFAHPLSVRGKIKAYLEKAFAGQISEGPIADLVNDAKALGVTDSVWYVDNLVHCATAAAIQPERREYREINRIGMQKIVERPSEVTTAAVKTTPVSVVEVDALAETPMPRLSKKVDHVPFETVEKIILANIKLQSEKLNFIKDTMPENLRWVTPIPEDFAKKCLHEMFTKNHVEKHPDKIYDEIFDLWQIYQAVFGAPQGAYQIAINDYKRTTAPEQGPGLLCTQVVVATIDIPGSGRKPIDDIASFGLNVLGTYKVTYNGVSLDLYQIQESGRELSATMGNRLVASYNLADVRHARSNYRRAFSIAKDKINSIHKCSSNGIPGGILPGKGIIWNYTTATGGESKISLDSLKSSYKIGGLCNERIMSKEEEEIHFDSIIKPFIYEMEKNSENMRGEQRALYEALNLFGKDIAKQVELKEGNKSAAEQLRRGVTVLRSLIATGMVSQDVYSGLARIVLKLDKGYVISKGEID
ncbi:MAG: hypothetical protein NTZ95_06465, partial [Candidatus Omnitrophica bacterium]|nr:hypothetical protein [Candidatus Omnitrophota bacterium]